MPRRHDGFKTVVELHIFPAVYDDMEPVMYVMAIMGCGDAGGLCSQARLDPARYASLRACQAATATTLARHADLDFPEIAAQCRPTNAMKARQMAARSDR